MTPTWRRAVAAVCVKRSAPVPMRPMVSEIASTTCQSMGDVEEDKEGYVSGCKARSSIARSGHTVSGIAVSIKSRSRDVGNCRKGLSPLKGRITMTATAVASGKDTERPP